MKLGLTRRLLLWGGAAFFALAGLAFLLIVLWRASFAVLAVTEPSLEGTARESAGGARVEILAAPPWPVLGPDLILHGVDAPSAGPADQRLFAAEALGFVMRSGLGLRAGAGTWNFWTAEPGVGPLALAGRNDADLLAVFLWLTAARLGPAEAGRVWADLTTDPAAALDSSGLLRRDHPLRPSLDQLSAGRRQGLYPPDWLNWGPNEVLQAVRSGRSRYGLLWSADFFSLGLEGRAPFTWVPSPPGPDRLERHPVVRLWQLEPGPGWAGEAPKQALRQALASDDSARRWLDQGGLILWGRDRPEVDQLSRDLRRSLAGSPRWLVLPQRGDLSAGLQALLGALRAEL